MSSDDNKNVDILPNKEELSGPDAPSAVATSEVGSTVGSIKSSNVQRRVSSSSERQIKFERAQKCLENAALVSKRIKEHRKATAELLGRPFEDDEVGDTTSEMASTMSERTGYSAATDTSTTLSVQEALNIPGISKSLANTLKQKEVLMERIKQYKEISKRPIVTSTTYSKRDTAADSSMEHRKVTDNVDLSRLQNSVKEKDNTISVLQVKMKAMETTIMDLQEKIGEKDMIIEAKTKATSLMSDNLSKKDKDSMALLEDTRHQMLRMQENFVAMETEWKDEKRRLVKGIEEKDEKIKHLEEANTILENSRFEISIAHSKVMEELNEKHDEIMKLQRKLEEMMKPIEAQNVVDVETTKKNIDTVEEEKGSLEIANMVELSKRVELLEQLNCQIRQTNKELENKLAMLNPDSKSTISSSPKKSSPLPSRKGGRSTSSKVKSPWSNLSEASSQDVDKKQNKNELSKMEMIVQSLNKEILNKEYIITQKDSLISELEGSIHEKDTLIDVLNATISEKDVQIQNVTSIEIERPEIKTQQRNVELSNVEHIEEYEMTQDNLSDRVTDLTSKLEAALDQIASLNNEIDAANKNMIKVKSNNKIKIKQMQKTIDNFSKLSDANTEIVKLNEEVHQLTQKVAELEEEKGNLQLHLVDYDSGRLTESESYRKLVELESLAESRLNAISILETQKFDLVQELHLLQQKNLEIEDKLADMSNLQNEHVCTEIQSLQLEEQLDELIAHKKEMELVIENLKLDKEQMVQFVKHLEREKEELSHKLENFIQENIQLADKLEKLTAEKVSSAESIEIVESLTTQEKLELEEYNKGVLTADQNSPQADDIKMSHYERNECLQKLTEESAELNKKIELFTLERQEVMEKMNSINSDNEILQSKIFHLTVEANKLRNDIEILNNEKHNLQTLNTDLNNQIEELKRERIDIMKENLGKPASNFEETTDNIIADLQQDEKSSGEKGAKGAKTVKQLTKDILKLKNVIKEREAEIADCQMKILSLEEQHEKQTELLHNNASYEAKLKIITDENKLLLEQVHKFKQDKEIEAENYLLTEKINKLKEKNESLQLELTKIHKEHNASIVTRDARVQELEMLLTDYENEIHNYNSTLQAKDKELSEYINQITKLNDVSQKLKSTIELLEEEKAKDQNTELIKSLNKQISKYQKTLTDYEEKLKNLEEENSKLLSLKSILETDNVNIESELKKVQESLSQKQEIMQKLQEQQQKFKEDLSSATMQVKERDEEIHEMKLQLRKESIENEKLRSDISEKTHALEMESKKLIDVNNKLNQVTKEKSDIEGQYTELEIKSKDLLEKLKKFAVTLKKKSTMYTDLETKFNDTQKQLELKEEHLQNIASKDIDEISKLQENVVFLEDELNQMKSQYSHLEQQKYNEVIHLQDEVKSLQNSLISSTNEIQKLTETVNLNNHELSKSREENSQLKLQSESFNKRVVELEIEVKNNINFTTKLSSLEEDIYQKQTYITDLLNKIETLEYDYNKVQFGYDAKIQERDLYIENLESDISKYKSRIGRLEESISEMENRRHSLERKADQLDVQLQDKYKAYSEYLNQEDELINRLAVLMDHDRVVDKQLHEIESDNKELQLKIQNVNEDNLRLRKIISDIQSQYETLTDKANTASSMESQLALYQERVMELENHIKRMTNEHQNIVLKQKQDIEELESEFTTQIDNAIKEKKVLSEKYEKLNDNAIQLERRLYEYKSNINNLNINLEEMSRLNQELRLKTKDKDMPDYTEQYIDEINKLNSMLNMKNNEIIHLNDSMNSIQLFNYNALMHKEKELENMKIMLSNSSTELGRLNDEIDFLSNSNQNLNKEIFNKDEQIRQIMEKKTMTFEMNIPKTEGMVISSTIEQLDTESTLKFPDTTLDSQIISDFTDSRSPCGKGKQMVKAPVHNIKEREVTTTVDPLCVNEPIIVPKKTYLCYKGSETTHEDNKVEEDITVMDPFNSDEGWGFDESGTISSEVMLDVARLNEQILHLKKENEKLQTDLEACNNKYAKALKKLRDLKTHNDILSNELKLSKQLSQPTAPLDTAIEDELKIQVQELEKTIDELQTKLISERREKESLRKQNEVLGNANAKMVDMKEKLDNEVELWKYKFKEVNDKMSSLHWETESKEVLPIKNTDITLNKGEINKLEKENDELHNQIDQLTKENNDINRALINLKDKLTAIKENQTRAAVCDNCKSLNDRLHQLENENKKIIDQNEIFKSKLQDLENIYNETIQKYNSLLQENQTKQQQVDENMFEHISKIKELNETYQLMTSKLNEGNDKINWLEIELAKSRHQLQALDEHSRTIKSFDDNNQELQDKYVSLTTHCEMLQSKLDDANEGKLLLEKYAEELTIKMKLCEQQSEEMNNKLQKLNTENDQLLSTVAELRSSVSSAVDQRGYEIAEMWKQHLAQREIDFTRIEQELRDQLMNSENKYEQLLDNMQSSSQEETNKLVVLEQATTLQNKLKDKEEHLINLQNKYAEVLNQMEILRSEMEDEKIMHENKLLTQQEEYEKQITEITISKQNINSQNAELLRLQAELTTTKEVNKNIVAENDELKSKIFEMEASIADMVNQICIKNKEIYEKTNDYTLCLSQRNDEFENVRQKLIDYEKKLEDLSYEKESELAILRLKMHENSSRYEDKQKEHENEKSNLIESLNSKVTECVTLNNEITELRKLLEEKSVSLTDMQAALETQEYEIITLKDELTNLQELLKTSTSKIEKHVTFASGTKPGPDESSAEEGNLNKELLELVPRAELDLALYMLHQRDMRCEELTMELTQLLEEIDTLQLRLSDSLRALEDMKLNCKSAGVDVMITSSQETLSETADVSTKKEQEIVDVHKTQGSRSSSVSESETDKSKLQAKLSELRSVRHSRDVRLRLDSEQRQIDMQLLQRDVANLPPEAAEQLRQAHHTLSRDTQSTSTVLLNWLRGKSTPKVVHM